MSASDLGVFVLATRGAAASEAGGSSAVKGNTEAAVKQAVCTGAHNLRAITRVSLRPLPQWAALQGCTAVALMAEHDDAEQASRQCARACGALARVRTACLGRAQRACATPLPQGGAKARSSTRGQRDVAVCLTSSAASVFVDADHVRSSPLGVHCQGVTVVTLLCVQSSMSSPLHHLSYCCLSVLICLQAPVIFSSCFCTSFSATPLRIAALTMMMIAFFTIKSNLVPLIKGLCTQI